MKNIFIQLCEKYTTDKKLIDNLWLEIVSRHNESHRHYHTLTHLNHLFKNLEPLSKQIISWDTILFSIFYHDIIYDISSNKNEEESASFAKTELSKLGISNFMINKVCELIHLTKAHTETKQIDYAYFLDADLAILGASPKEYQTYIKQIKEEYKLYSDIIYHKGRQEVLRKFMEKKELYQTDYFKNRYERQAHANMAMEIK
ncbi:MAG: hypothetical protein KAG56_07120 [Sulfurovaceae bacterium]|nr:hypothetical protein [Sulfurovaceae bacterium]